MEFLNPMTPRRCNSYPKKELRSECATGPGAPGLPVPYRPSTGGQAARGSRRMDAVNYWDRYEVLVPLLLLVLAGFLNTACRAPQRTYQPEMDPNRLGDTVFLHYLASVPVVSVDEGIRAVLLLVADDGHRLKSYETRYESLRDRGAIKPRWNLSPGQVLNKGTLAYMLRTVCHLPKSLNELLAARTGWGDRRNALKVCIHEGIMPYGLPHEPVKGGELLSALTAAEENMDAVPGP